VADGPVLVSVAVADDPERWRDAGFAVAGSACRVGAVRFDLGGDGDGIRSWSLTDVAAGVLDGLETHVAEDGPSPGPPGPSIHPNGTVSLDHLVVTSHDVVRTVAALEARGFEVRRRWDNADRRYTFFRVGEAILELVGPAQADGDRPARFFGLAFTVDDIDATAAHLGSLLGDVRDAVQPGRRIATLRRQAGLSVPVAFMSPGPAAA
jgi:hypothetical protein